MILKLIPQLSSCRWQKEKSQIEEALQFEQTGEHVLLIVHAHLHVVFKLFKWLP
jgi:hypothetical protein